jgi:Protein of unknown function (DUF2587)
MTRVGERAPRLVIALDRQTTGRGACRVEAPARMLRMWTVLNAANDELHQAAPTPGALRRLRRSLQVIRTELERSVSAPLADELSNLLPPQETWPSIDELRIECAGLLGWTAGLALGMLDRVQAAAVASAPASAAGARPDGSAHSAAPAA